MLFVFVGVIGAPDVSQEHSPCQLRSRPGSSNVRISLYFGIFGPPKSRLECIRSDRSRRPPTLVAVRKALEKPPTNRHQPEFREPLAAGSKHCWHQVPWLRSQRSERGVPPRSAGQSVTRSHDMLIRAVDVRVSASGTTMLADRRDDGDRARGRLGIGRLFDDQTPDVRPGMDLSGDQTNRRSCHRVDDDQWSAKTSWSTSASTNRSPHSSNCSASADRTR